MKIENERQVIEFIEAVFKRDHLRREFRRVFESIDTLTANLNKNAEQALLINLRSYLDESAAELDVAEQTVDALLPHARTYRGMLALSAELNLGAEDRLSDVDADTIAPNTPCPPEPSQEFQVEAASCFEAPPSGPKLAGALDENDPFDESPPDRPPRFDDLKEDIEPSQMMHIIEDREYREEEMLFRLNGNETDV
jgi:hypothetical protein